MQERKQNNVPRKQRLYHLEDDESRGIVCKRMDVCIQLYCYMFVLENMSQISKVRGFKMGLLNINGLFTHIDELRITMSRQALDILAVNESKIDSSISDGQIYINGYQIVRKDRNKSGVEFVFMLEIPSVLNSEMIFLTITWS